MENVLPLRKVRHSIHSLDSEDGESTATSIDRRACRKQPSRDVRSFPFRFLEKFRYSRLQDYPSKGKCLFEKFRPLTTIENLPLPFARRDYEHGEEWIKGALLCGWGSGAILTLNIVLMTIAIAIGYSKSSSDKHFTYAELYRGDCSVTSGWATGMHLVINVLSTALLAASNYVMQCLSAPSRADIDKAHSKRRWLDIGTFSWRNFSAMEGKRKALCILLLVSSLPIHMMYNSTIFSSISTMGHGTAVIPNDLGSNEPLVKDNYEAKSFYNHVGFSADDVHAEIFNGTFQNLTMSECVNRYHVEYNTGGGTLLLVTDRVNFYGSSSLVPISFYDYYPDERWMYRQVEDTWLGVQTWKQHGWEIKASHLNYPRRTFQIPVPDGGFVVWPENYVNPKGSESLYHDMSTLTGYIISHNPDDAQLDVFLETPSNWDNSSWVAQVSFQTEGPSRGTSQIRYTPYEWDDLHNIPNITISHCMAKDTAQRCHLYFSLPLCLVVIACNVLKVTCMYMAAKTHHREIFLTIGDSLSSFLKSPDAATEGRCFMSWSAMAKGLRPWKVGTTEIGDDMPSSDVSTHGHAQVFPGLLPRRRRRCRAASWKRWIIIVVLYLACFAVFLILFLFFRGEGSDFWNTEIGKSGGSSIIVPGRNIIALVLLANSPQLVFSTLYYLCNGLLTCMLAVAEYNDFAARRKPLRVSWPKGHQRSTYYLSLPYRYSVFLITTSIVMHWLLSQSIFLVKIVAFDMYGQRLAESSGASSIERTVTACGYSRLAMFITLVVGTVAMAVLVGIGMAPLRSNMPLASSCSAAISAACHPLPDDTDAFLKPVMWGEVPEDSRDNQNGCASYADAANTWRSSHARCTFTSKEVVTPASSLI